MFRITRNEGRQMSVLAVAIGALVAAAPAVAQDGSAAPKRPEVSNARPTSPSVTVNLVNALVKQGVLTEEQAQALIKQAEDEAYVARQAAKDANTKADEAAKTATAAAAAASPPGTKRVTYVPEVVKKQLREDLRREVMQQARAEGWASPGKYPEWASRIRFYGDLRTRYEGQFFPTAVTMATTSTRSTSAAPMTSSASEILGFRPTTGQRTASGSGLGPGWVSMLI